MQCKQFTTFSANGLAYPVEKEIPVTLEADEPRHLESGVLNIYPDITYQTIEGFGGAMTETSAYLFSKMGAATRKAALEEYFGEHGNHVRFIKSPLTAVIILWKNTVQLKILLLIPN